MNTPLNIPGVRFPGLPKKPANIVVGPRWLLAGYNPGTDKTYGLEPGETPFAIAANIARAVPRVQFAAEVGDRLLQLGRVTLIYARSGTRPTSTVVAFEVGGSKIGWALEIQADTQVQGNFVAGSVALVNYNAATDNITPIAAGLQRKDIFRYVTAADFANEVGDEFLVGGRFSVIQARTGTRPSSRVCVLELGQNQFAFALELPAPTADAFGGTTEAPPIPITYDALTDTISPQGIAGLSPDMIAGIQAGVNPSLSNPFLTKSEAPVFDSAPLEAEIDNLLPAPLQPDGVRLVTDRIRTESEIVFGTEAVADSRITITPSSIVASAASSQSYFGSANIVLKEDNISFFAQPGQLTFFTGNGTTIPRARIAYGEGGELLLTANHVRVPTPTAEQDAATKLYVDSLVDNAATTGIRPGTGTNSIIVGDIGETNEAPGQDSICVGGYNNIAAGTRSSVHDGHDTEVYGADCAAYSSVGCVIPATAERVRLLGCTAFTVPAGTLDKVYVNNQGINAAGVLRDIQDVPDALRNAVTAGTYANGELQGVQPDGSLSGLTFTTTTYGYAYQRGANGALVWNRFVKA